MGPPPPPLPRRSAGWTVAAVRQRWAGGAPPPLRPQRAGGDGAVDGVGLLPGHRAAVRRRAPDPHQRRGGRPAAAPFRVPFPAPAPAQPPKQGRSPLWHLPNGLFPNGHLHRHLLCKGQSLREEGIWECQPGICPTLTHSVFFRFFDSFCQRLSPHVPRLRHTPHHPCPLCGSKTQVQGPTGFAPLASEGPPSPHPIDLSDERVAPHSRLPALGAIAVGRPGPGRGDALG